MLSKKKLQKKENKIRKGKTVASKNILTLFGDKQLTNCESFALLENACKKASKNRGKASKMQ